jgi:uncharacterized membrane protein YdbT with pleckstrin-like domain
MSMVLRVYPDRLALERGILSKKYNEVYLRNIRTIEVHQSFSERLIRVGKLRIATAGTTAYEIEVSGIANPLRTRDLLLQQGRT